MNKKKLITELLALLILVACAFGGYMLYNKKSIDKSVPNEETASEQKKDVDTTTPLTDKEKSSYAEAYQKNGQDIEKKTTVSDAEVNDYLAKNKDIQYPAKKLVTTDKGGNEKVYFLDGGSPILEHNYKKGDDTEYGKFVSLEDLSDADKKQVLTAIIHADKVSKEIIKEIRSNE